MHVFIILIFSITTGVLGNSTTQAPTPTTQAAEDDALPIEAMNCINDFKDLHTKWNTVKELCKQALQDDPRAEDYLALLSKPSFQKCVSEVLNMESEIIVTGKKCRAIGKPLSKAQRLRSAKLFRESIT